MGTVDRLQSRYGLQAARKATPVDRTVCGYVEPLACLRSTNKDLAPRVFANCISLIPSTGPVFKVFIKYGPVPNRLLRLYGFVLPNNPHDSYELVLTTHHLAPLYDKKVALFIAAKLDVNSAFSLTFTELLPDKVLQYLRIQRSTSQELTTILATANTASKPFAARMR
ncbi:hypothetical protein BC936DRAFT_143371 [Jimgerdemannia flammicorona]|uniref:Rubisco LSMT substrate-binding domain-containing protein n=1 Tax=Jimgerdemannia flammicorona TaxID=994334 RepID=A0A433DE09_9FUNG|nr:hypothetical protein BC936DRAFT_143371 [Jimgerdemannia flammicorona]